MTLFNKTGLIILAISSCFIACKKDAMIKDGQFQMDLLDSANNLRAKGCNCGLDYMPPVKALIWNDQLAIAAEAHAKDMFNRNYFEHISPEGISPIQRAKTVNYLGNTVTENIGKGYSNSIMVMAAWRKSEYHCKAIMNSSSIEMGAYSYNGYWVQEFGH